MLALLLWFLSEVIFAYYPLVVGIMPPFPSLVDALDLAAYLPVVVGLLIQLWPFGSEALAGWKVKAALVVLGIAFVLTIYLLLPITLRSQQSLAGVLVSLGYPILDFISLFLAIPAFAIFNRGTFWRPSLFLLGGLVLGSIGDIYLAFAVLSGAYYLGHPVELLFDFAFISGALAFYLRREQFLTKSI
jgi:hypothetical protein